MPKALVVGSGPNGLAAAIQLARAGVDVEVHEAAQTAGGGLTSAECTLPGFTHDVCASIFPFARISPFFRTIDLPALGVDLIDSPILLAHPLDGGRAACVYRSVDETAAHLGRDRRAYGSLVGSLARSWPDVAGTLLGPLLRVPRHPLSATRFGGVSWLPASSFSRAVLREEPARALFAGMSAHQTLPLEHPFTSAFGFVLLMAAHTGGWPFPSGGAQRLGDALVRCLEASGGRVVTNSHVTSLAGFGGDRTVLFDTNPAQAEAIAGPLLPGRYRRKLRAYRAGPGVFKIDYALDAPIPWSALECHQAATVHVGGTAAEIAAAKRDINKSGTSARPFVIVGQQSLFDDSRAPDAKHTAWAYCQVANGSTLDATAAIEAQIERFAPGFTRRILARRTWSPADLEAHNANLVGGDLNGGSLGGLQMFFRPTLGLSPYRTPNPRLYVASASTPPGGGVHGMCGWHAAAAALRGMRR